VVTTALTIPAGTAAGSYYLIAKADGDTLVPETNETNNTRVSLISVSSP
jgi:subtilase family serine protease